MIIIKKNTGKIFENNIADSCPDYILVKKLADNASSWSGGQNTRFASKNECDYIMHNEKNGIFYGLELKSTIGSNFTFWKKELEEDDKKRSYMIKKHQILGLKKWNDNHKGIFGFLLNFKKYDNRTFFVSIDNFYNYIQKIEKTCINLKDVLQMNPIEIPNHIKKTNYSYDMDFFFKETEKINTKKIQFQL